MLVFFLVLGSLFFHRWDFVLGLVFFGNELICCTSPILPYVRVIIVAQPQLFQE